MEVVNKGVGKIIVRKGKSTPGDCSEHRCKIQGRKRGSQGERVKKRLRGEKNNKCKAGRHKLTPYRGRSGSFVRMENTIRGVGK